MFLFLFHLSIFICNHRIKFIRVNSSEDATKDDVSCPNNSPLPSDVSIIFTCVIIFYNI